MSFRSFRSVFNSLVVLLCVSIGSILGVLVGFLISGDFGKAAIAFFVGILFTVVISYVCYKEQQIIFSKIYILESGVKNIVGREKDFFISWEECKDIGFSSFSTGKRSIYVVVFSKDIRKETYIWEEVVSDRHIMMQIRNNVMEEIFKYIPRERIKNLEALTRWEQRKYGFTSRTR